MKRLVSARMHQARRTRAHLHITSSSIKIEMQVLDLSEIPKLVLNVFFRSLFMDVGGEYDPSLYSFTERSVNIGLQCSATDSHRAARVSDVPWEVSTLS